MSSPETARHPPALGGKLRFGVMCSGTTFPAWQASCLDRLLALGFVDPALLILDDAATRERTLGKLKQLRPTRALPWKIFSFVTKLRSRALRSVDMSAALAGIPQLPCKVLLRGRFSQHFVPADLAAIRAHDLDFILRFGFNIIRGEILEVARYGVWSFHHDDEEKYRGGPPGYWEIHLDDPVTGAILQRLSDRLDAGTILRKGFWRTIRTSYAQNRDRVFLESAGWPAQVCIDIANGVAGYLSEPASSTTAPILRAPTLPQMLRFSCKLWRNRFVRLCASVFYEDRWNVGIVPAPIHAFLHSPTPPPRWLAPALDHGYVADPFAVHDGDVIHAVVEEYDYRAGKGRLAALEVQGGRARCSPVGIDVQAHASYPYLFVHDGRIYCVPETHEADEVSLYEAEAFPLRWKKVRTLVQRFAGLDNTVFRYEDRWWLLATAMDDGANEKLHVWHAETLDGPWQPHAQNPVKIDVRSARCAGTPFWHRGQLYRPAQDCSLGYGAGLTLNRVVRLTPREFEEELVTRIAPDAAGPYPHGMHTLCGVGDMTLVDGKRQVFVGRSLPLLLHRVGYLVGRHRLHRAARQRRLRRG